MKRILFLLLLNSIVLYSSGQSYIQPSIGFAFSSQPFEEQSTIITNNYKTVYNIKLKYGEGIYVGLNYGYHLNKNFFVELSTKKSIYTQQSTSTPQPDFQHMSGSFSASGYFGNIEYRSSVFQAAPLIGYELKRNRFNLYFKLGPSFMKSTIKQTLKFISWKLDNFSFLPQNTIEKYKYSGNIHLGLQANLGVNYSIKQYLKLALDFITVYNNDRMTKGKITYYEVDGVNQIDQLPKTDFTPADASNKINFSNFGFSIGLKYVFHRSK